MLSYNPKYPAIADIIKKAKKQIPQFVFEYMDGGCNEDVNLAKNTSEIRDIELKPFYLNDFKPANMQTELFGVKYDAPFGVAPIGLQGLIWPKAPEILAKAAVKNNIPFILSTVSTASIEKIAKITEGKFWFQLYHPAEQKITDDILDRLDAVGCKTLVLLSDVPTFAFRPRDIRNGLAMPPQMTVKNMIQIMLHPEWALNTLYHGQPSFKTMEKYMDKSMNMKQLGLFMNKTFSGRMTPEKIAPIRDRWKGNLVMKGAATVEDTDKCVKLGLDGIIVSNHGGRQLDAGESTIKSLKPIVDEFKGKLKIMIDSGMRSGPDIARVLASGAEFAFLGRTFMYSVAALGKGGGDHAIGLLKLQIQQVMEQICCENVEDLPGFLIKK
jgi:L-lactate dehydrogenase (cytochrome)